MNRAGIVCLAVSMAFATACIAVAADEIVITHRSGKVQTLRIEQPDDPVESVSFKPGRADQTATPAAAPVPASIVVPTGQAAPELVNVTPVKEAATKAAKEDKGSGNIKLKWAEPIDAGY